MNILTFESKSLRLPRIAALLVAAGTLIFLGIGGDVRSDNEFLVPDLVLSVGLLVAAALPARWARAGLMVAFGIAAGVLGSAVSDFVVQGRIGVGALFGMLVSLAMAAALALPPQSGRASEPGAQS